MTLLHRTTHRRLWKELVNVQDVVHKARLWFLQGRILDEQMGREHRLPMPKLQGTEREGGPLKPMHKQSKDSGLHGPNQSDRNLDGKHIHTPRFTNLANLIPQEKKQNVIPRLRGTPK